MHKYLLVLITGMLLIVFTSCSDENTNFGLNPEGDLSVQFENLDSLSLLFSTLKFDTITTSDAARMLVGLSTSLDERPGSLASKAFFTLGVSAPGSLFASDQDRVFDSVTIRLQFDGYYSGDSSQLITYTVSRLDEILEFDEEFTPFYGLSTFDFDETDPLGSTTIFPRPLRGQPFEIRLKDDFGQNFFDLLVSQDDQVSTSNTLRDYLRGFVLHTDQTHDFMVGVVPDIRMLLYYTQNNGELTDQSSIEFAFSLVDSEIRKRDVYFSSYTTDFSSTGLSSISSREDNVFSSETNRVSYISGARGLATRIDLPSLYVFAEQLDNEFINSTILRIRPRFLQGANPNNFMRSLNVDKVNGNNEITASYNVTGPLALDEEFDTNTYYEVDISPFIQEQLDDSRNNNNGLLIRLNNIPFLSTTESLVVGDGRNRNLKSNLNINIIKRRDE